MANIPLCVYMYMSIYIFLHIYIFICKISEHLGCFYILTIANAALNIGMHISFGISVTVLFGQIPRSDIAGSYSRPIFNFLRILYTVLQNGCTNLQSHQQCMRVPFSPHPCQLLLLVLFENSGSDRC
ncbi:hypothetical protein HJG60_010169 [Phyllostomus discolor]|uniref:Uncharacterized protein n=1 Tax=Phyllostomus discolor TaxID=89673 RepID=A0A834AYV7_9CHIR|nr:hypothetical protein HJG60_010169 [Phyllostomus discolor]